MKTICYLLVLILGFVSSVYSQAPEIAWTQTFGGIEKDIIRSVQQTTDGGYISTGNTKSFGAGDYDVYLIKTDASGAEEWSKTFGGTDWDMGRSVQQTTDGGYVIAGYTKSFGAGSYDVYLIKTDASGTELWSQYFGGADEDIGYSIQQTSDGGYIVAGWTYSFGVGDSDAWLIKIDAELTGIGQENSKIGPANHIILKNYPNPFSDRISISSNSSSVLAYDLIDNFGKVLIQGHLPPGAQSTINTSHLKPGLYLLRLHSDDQISAKKIIKL